MSFADSWYRASCALLLLTLHFSMFSFYLPLSFSLSLSLAFSFSLSLSLSLSLFISAPSFSLWLQDTCHLMPFTKYSLLDQSYFFTPYLSIAHKIHQLFTDYLLWLPSSELLEKHLFRSRANRRLVSWRKNGDTTKKRSGSLAQQKRSDHQPIGRLAGLRVSSTDVVRVEKLRKWQKC